MSASLLNADHHEVYFEGVPRGPLRETLRRHGDRMERLPDGYWRGHGRADDAMNLGGIKISSAEIERALQSIPDLAETAAIAVSRSDGPSLLVIYAVRSGTSGSSKADLMAAQTHYDLAAETAKRYDALTTLAVTQQEKDNMDATAAADKSLVAAAQQTVDQYQAMTNFKKIVAPFAGIVTARRVEVGDFINSSGADASLHAASQASFSVADVSKLRIFVSVPQDFGALLKPGLKADLTLPGAPGKKIPAQFLTMAGAVSPHTRTIVTELVVDNTHEGLLPGAYVNVNFSFPSDPDILIIPSQALLFRADGMQVARIDGQNRVHLQKVLLGHNLGLDVQIVAGLKATDKIVANPSP